MKKTSSLPFVLLAVPQLALAVGVNKVPNTEVNDHMPLASVLSVSGVTPSVLTDGAGTCITTTNGVIYD